MCESKWAVARLEMLSAKTLYIYILNMIYKQDLALDNLQTVYKWMNSVE